MKGAVAFLIYDFIQIMAIGEWSFIKQSRTLTIIWQSINAALCLYITWWIVTEKLEIKPKKKKPYKMARYRRKTNGR